MKKYGLPKTCLLRKSKEYEQVYKRGTRLHGSGFSLVSLANDLGYNRLGISVSRKVKGAVKRNRIKRIIRESFRLGRQHYPACSDIVFVVKPHFDKNSPHDVTQAVTRLASASGISDES